MTINYEIQKVRSGFVVVHFDKKGRPMPDSDPRSFETYEEAEDFAKASESARRKDNQGAN